MKHFSKIIFTLIFCSNVVQAQSSSRTVYFAGAASSNVTLDYGLKECTQLTATASDARFVCTLPTISCKINVSNFSSVPQTVSTDIQFPLEFPAVSQAAMSDSKAGFFIFLTFYTPSTPDAFTASDGSTVNTYIAASTANPGVVTTANLYRFDFRSFAWAGDLTEGASLATQAVAAPVTLQPNQTLLVERRISPTYYVRYIGDATSRSMFFNLYAGHIQEFGIYARAKMSEFCSGAITATSNAGEETGFLLASGSLSYYASSYLNWPTAYSTSLFNASGWGSVTPNLLTRFVVDLRTGINQSGCTDGCSCLANGYGASVLDLNGSCSAFQTYTDTTYTSSSGTAYSNQSSTHPLHVAEAPITINAGVPF